MAEVPVFDEGIYPSTVAAEEDSTLLFIDKRDMRQLCLEHPQIALAALKLLAEARSRGSRAGAGINVELAHNNQQIAARVGSVREVVSRALARLQQEGLITIERRRLTIPDERALSLYAGEDSADG